MLGDDENGYYLPTDYYSYEMDWSDGSEGVIKEREPYLLLKLKFKAIDKDGEFGAVKDYFYQIPVNYRSPTSDMTEEQKNRLYQLNRNHLYHVISDIELLGGEDIGEPFEVESSISIEPWVENTISGDMDAVHFLMVRNRNPIMANIDYLEIDYLTSLPIEIVNKDIYHITYDKNYKDTIVQVSSDNLEIINDTISSKIIIMSDIPINYVPLNIKFRLQHKLSGEPKLYQDIIVTQYPPKYITAEKSDGDVLIDENGNGGLYQRNFNLFKITTLVPEEGERIGDPTHGSNESGKDDKSNKLISPEFIIASQKGVTRVINQATAFARCEIYYEFTYGSGEMFENKGYWRVPTKAELEYIDALQDDPNSAVKKLLEGTAYMSAFGGENKLYNFYTNIWMSKYPLYEWGEGYTRCVFDTWKLKNHK